MLWGRPQSLSKAASRRPPASAPLPLPAAPDARRSAAANQVPSNSEILLMEIRAISINLSQQVGADDSLLWVRIVPDGRDGKVVFARTLRVGESDPGVPVVVDPTTGETLQFKPGSVKISISHIDQHAQRDADGFAPISNTLWTSAAIGSPVSIQVFHHLLATGRHLDGTHSLLVDVIRQMESLSGGFIHRRQQAFEAFALAEILVVALGRTADLAERLRITFNVSTTLPDQLSLKNRTDPQPTKCLRTHRGSSHGPSPWETSSHAYSVFDQREFVTNGVLSYGAHRISLRNDIAPLLLDIRKYLLEVAIEFAGPSKQIAAPIQFFQEK